MTSAVELRAASADEAAAWQEMWEERQRAAWAAQGLTSEDVAERFSHGDRMRREAAEFSVSVVVADGEVAGYAVGALFGPPSGLHGLVVDLWISPSVRRLGYGHGALTALLSWLRTAGADRAQVTLDPEDAGQAALFRDGEVNSQRMELRLGSAESLAPFPDGLSWRPLADSEYPGWLAAEIEGYARSNVESGALSETAAQVRAEEVYAQLLPDGLGTSDNTITVLEDGGEVVAHLWLRHHYRHEQSFLYSVVVQDGRRGKGYGRTIMRLGERLSLGVGDRVLGLNVFGHNEVAIGLYNSLGYIVTDQSRTILL